MIINCSRSPLSDPRKVEEFKRLFGTGETYKEISQALGVHQATITTYVLRYRDELDWSMRRRPRGISNLLEDREYRERLVDLLKTDMTPKEIAKELNVSVTTVYNQRKKLNETL